MADLSDITLLLVEDDPLIAVMQKRILTEHGYTVITATTGELAVEIAATDAAVRLILMDIDLGPGIDGTEAARRILSRRELPIVFVTSHAEREYVERAKQITRYGYVLKSAGHFVLLSSIEMALELFASHAELRAGRQALRSRVIALSQPPTDTTGITFEDLFDLQEIQRIQDTFAAATGVASIITAPDGTPITQPSNFRRLCSQIVRATTIGFERCRASDAEIGRPNQAGPTVRPCASCGLWDAGAAITVGGRHLASWLIGQIRAPDATTEAPLAYAEQIGADPGLFEAAWNEVPVMEIRQFVNVANALHVFANELSLKAFQNTQQARIISSSETTERRLATEMARYRHLFERVPVPILIVDQQDRIIDSNQAFTNVFQFQPDETRGRFINALLVPDHLTHEGTDLSRQVLEGRSIYRITQRRRKDGSLVDVAITGAPITIEGQTLVYGIYNDITELKTASANLQRVVRQKETLLRELQHRVKNNLNVVESLLSLEAAKLSDPDQVRVFSDAQNRIRTMSSVYQRLYLSDDLTNIDLHVYAAELVDSVVRAYQIDAARVRVVARLQSVRMDAKRAAPLGLILNEAISNALKYAYPQPRSGVIHVELSQTDGRVELNVSDKGVGLPANFNTRVTNSMGMTLVHLLAEQVGAEVSIDSQTGTRVSVSMPI